VRQEIDWWLAHRSIERLIIVVTGGELTWDASRRDFQAEQSSALPPNLLGRFHGRTPVRGPALGAFANRAEAELGTVPRLDPRHRHAASRQGQGRHRRRRPARAPQVAPIGIRRRCCSGRPDRGPGAIAYFAVGQRNLAESRVDTALAGRLAAQAGASQDKEPSLVERNTLLAIEAMRRKPSLEAAMALRAGMSLLPVPVGRVLHARARAR
jgi:hypothetical protein